MSLAYRARMLRRPLALGLLVGLFAAATLSARADAAGAFLPGAGQAPVEQRIAIAAGPSRTTLWTSVRFSGASGAVGLVLPAPPGSALDVSSDAWLEALEVATAERVFPPDGISPYCPGVSGDPDPFHIAGAIFHEPTLPPAQVSVLPDAGAVALWAASAGLALSPEAASTLGAMQGVRFVTARFAAPGGPALTRTLRIAMPSAPAVLPLALTRAGAGELLVTAWLFGAGEAALDGTTSVTVQGSTLVWNAATLESDYEAARMAALSAAAPSGAVLECASHEALSYNQVIPGSAASIDGVVTTYFKRADMYGDATGDPATCASLAAAALASNSPVSVSCPRADHGIVDGVDTCVESPTPAETDPERLRCGPVTDDLAVGLSEMLPSGAWLTRISLRIAAGDAGADWPLTFGPGVPALPVLEAGSVTQVDCGAPDAGPDGSGAGPSTSSSGTSTASGMPTGSSSSGGTSGTGTVIYEDDYYGNVGCDCSGTAVDEGSGGYGGSYSDETYASDDGCSSDTTDTYESSDDGCSSDTTDTYSSESGDDGCSSDTTDTYSESGDDGCSSDTTDTTSSDSSADCSGDSTGDGSSSSSDGCSSDTGGTSDGSSSGCSGGTGDGSSDGTKCSIGDGGRPVARKARPRRLSPALFLALSVLVPLRRITRRRRGSPS